MSPRFDQVLSRFRQVPTAVWRVATAVVLVVLVSTTSDWWWPVVERLIAGPSDSSADDVAESEDVHADSIDLSAQARRNIGLETGEVRLEDYTRQITIPAVVVDRPGRTNVQVVAPMTGVVTGVHAIRGQTVASRELLFRVRLTHEDLVNAQVEFLKTLGQLDVEEQEIARLEKIAGGAVAQQVVLQRKYERDKLDAALSAQRESLRLHGLNADQVEAIAASRRLLRELNVYAPLVHEDSSIHDDAEPSAAHPIITRTASTADQAADRDGTATHAAMSQRFVVEDLAVQTGESVQAGQRLAVLADYRELYVEGRAFEQDAEELVDAAREGRRATAIPEGNGHARLSQAERRQARRSAVEGLEIVYVANRVEPASRALHFYVALPNEIVNESPGRAGRPFVTWRFKLGQRMQLRVPVDVWQNVIVLPVDAVAQEGPEFYVFVENGDHFDRRPVHVKHRDQFDAVIENDGSLFPGESVALSSAHQLQMALKNKAGGGVDPHAGHSH